MDFIQTIFQSLTGLVLSNAAAVFLFSWGIFSLILRKNSTEDAEKQKYFRSFLFSWIGYAILTATVSIACNTFFSILVIQVLLIGCIFLPLSIFCNIMKKKRSDDEKKKLFWKRLSILFLILFIVAILCIIAFLIMLAIGLQHM